MKITDIPYTPTYFDTYIRKVGDLDLSAALQQSLAAIDALDIDKLKAIGDEVYAPGKWTIRDPLLHITDTERIFSYRALRFARNDSSAQPGFDENSYAENAGANRRPLEDIIAELRCVRQSCIFLFNALNETELRRIGIMFNAEVSVLAIGFTIVGHQNHHLGILEERYLPLFNR